MWLSGFNPQAIQDLEGARRAILELMNLVESMNQGNRSPPLPTREELSDNQVCNWGEMSHFRQK